MGKNTRRRAFDKIKNFTTMIGANMQFTGDITGTDNCIVYGAVTGDCQLDGSLVVSQDGRWHGNIQGLNVLIAGEVEGDVIAGNQLEVLPTAKIVGRLICPNIAIAQGAVHRGEVRMSRDTKVTRFDERRIDEDSER